MFTWSSITCPIIYWLERCSDFHLNMHLCVPSLLLCMCAWGEWWGFRHPWPLPHAVTQSGVLQCVGRERRLQGSALHGRAHMDTLPSCIYIRYVTARTVVRSRGSSVCRGFSGSEVNVVLMCNISSAVRVVLVNIYDPVFPLKQPRLLRAPVCPHTLLTAKHWGK